MRFGWSTGIRQNHRGAELRHQTKGGSNGDSPDLFARRRRKLQNGGQSGSQSGERSNSWSRHCCGQPGYPGERAGLERRLARYVRQGQGTVLSAGASALQALGALQTGGRVGANVCQACESISTNSAAAPSDDAVRPSGRLRLGVRSGRWSAKNKECQLESELPKRALRIGMQRHITDSMNEIIGAPVCGFRTCSGTWMAELRRCCICVHSFWRLRLGHPSGQFGWKRCADWNSVLNRRYVCGHARPLAVLLGEPAGFHYRRS